MANEYFYRLVSLPLFQGLQREDALNMAGRARFDFRRHLRGDRILRSDVECRELIFVIQGDYKSEEKSPLGDFMLTEYFRGPAVLQPERLFGRDNYYTKSYFAESDDVQLLVVNKRDVRDVLFSFTPFHINYLNHICTTQQTLRQTLWETKSENLLRERFCVFMRHISSTPKGHKLLSIGMTELADKLLTTRRNISALLHQLENEGIVNLQRSSIDIPELDQLLRVD